MHSVLSIDCTGDATRLVITQIEAGGRMEVLEEKALPFGLIGVNSAPATEAPPADGDAADAAANVEEENPEGPAGRLKDALAQLKNQWAASVLLLQDPSQLSLNLALPFGDARNINKILAMEVQDVVPFDVSEFVLQHATTTANGQDGAFDVHISAVPRGHVRQALGLCRKAGFEPYVITTPGSALAAAYQLAPGYFARNCLFLYPQPGFFWLATFVDGTLRCERLVDVRQAGAGKPFADLKLQLAALEQRYQCQFEKVYLFGALCRPQDVQQAVGRTVEQTPFRDFVTAASDEAGPAALGAVFARDGDPPAPLTNFRVQEFAYSFELRELAQALKRCRPYLVSALTLIVFALGLLYAGRAWQISRLERGLRREIEKAIPGVNFSEGQELQQLQQEYGRLDASLKDLGSYSKLSPLDGLVAISRDLGVSPDSPVEIREVSIKGARIKIDGSAPDYAAAEKLERTLKKKRDVYCRVRREAAGSAQGTARGFSFEIVLCE